MRLVLASASPRRRDMLGGLGYALRLAPADIDETPWPDEDPVAYALRMAQTKADATPSTAGETVVAADTVVHRDGRIYGKPRDADDAAAMLRALAGRRHQVTSAFCVRDDRTQISRAVSTEVCFRELSDAEIRGYVATGEPADKAGAYGIQGVGGFLVAEIRGSYSNVVGLPLAELLDTLRSLGWPPPFHPLTEPSP